MTNHISQSKWTAISENGGGLLIREISVPYLQNYVRYDAPMEVTEDKYMHFDRGVDLGQQGLQRSRNTLVS